MTNNNTPQPAEDEGRVPYVPKGPDLKEGTVQRKGSSGFRSKIFGVIMGAGAALMPGSPEAKAVTPPPVDEIALSTGAEDAEAFPYGTATFTVDLEGDVKLLESTGDKLNWFASSSLEGGDKITVTVRAQNTDTGKSEVTEFTIHNRSSRTVPTQLMLKTESTTDGHGIVIRRGNSR